MPSSPSSCSSEQESVRATSLLTSCPPLPGQSTASRTGMAMMLAGRSEPRRPRLPLSRNEGQTSTPEHHFRIAEQSAWLASTNSSLTPVSDRNTSASATTAAIAHPSVHAEHEPSRSEGVVRIGASMATSTSTIITTTKHQGTALTPLPLDQFKRPTSSSVTEPMGDKEHRNENLKEAKETDRDNKDPKEENPKRKMSADKLIPKKKTRKQRTRQSNSDQSNGRWTQQEHHAFLEGLKECGREWKKVALRIPTRTSAQIRSHAQKYFSKVEREHDISLVQEAPASSGGVGSSVRADISTPTTTTTAATPAAILAPSVQRRVETILANPAEAQRQVESTLEALRERYRQLQLRLQQRQLQRNTQFSRDQFDSPSRKRSLAESSRPRVESFSSTWDEQSSASSHLSASVASMGNDELIALSVLGARLPRGDSSQDLVPTGLPAYSDDSVASSTNDHDTADNDGNNNESTNQFDQDDPSLKRRRSG